MDKAVFPWKEYDASLVINESVHGKIYGKVCRSGRVHWRNYGRQLKNGKGLSILDHLKENIMRGNNLTKYLLEKRVFRNG
jgi:hypothetical protein